MRAASGGRRGAPGGQRAGIPDPCRRGAATAWGLGLHAHPASAGRGGVGVAAAARRGGAGAANAAVRDIAAAGLLRAAGRHEVGREVIVSMPRVRGLCGGESD